MYKSFKELCFHLWPTQNRKMWGPKLNFHMHVYLKPHFFDLCKPKYNVFLNKNMTFVKIIFASLWKMQIKKKLRIAFFPSSICPFFLLSPWLLALVMRLLRPNYSALTFSLLLIVKNTERVKGAYLLRYNHQARNVEKECLRCKAVRHAISWEKGIFLTTIRIPLSKFPMPSNSTSS
jgi:hypothetical protein